MRQNKPPVYIKALFDFIVIMAAFCVMWFIACIGFGKF